MAIAGLAVYSINSLSSLAENLIEHPFQVTDHAQCVKSNLIEMDRDMGELIYSSRVETIAKLVSHIRELKNSAEENLDVVGQFYLGPKDDVSQLRQALTTLELQHEQAISLKQAGRPSEAIAILQPEGKSPQLQAEREIQKILNFARNKAASFQNQSDVERDRTLRSLLAFIIVLIILGILCARLIGRSVTQTQEAMRRMNERLSLAASAGRVGIWDFDVVKNTLTWDDQMFALYGVNREQFSGAYEAWRSGLYPEDEARGDLEIQLALRGEKDFNTEFRVLRPDGSIRHIRALAKVQRDEQGKPLRMIGTNWDITDQVQNRSELQSAKQKADDSLVQQRRLQDDLVQAEKLAALGGLVAGVAHEINTPVGITLGAATHLSAETQKADVLYQAGELTEEGLNEYFATAKQASQLMTINSRRAADLIQSFKQVAVDQTGGELRDFDLAGYLNEILMSLGSKLRKQNVEVKIDCPAGILLHGLPGALSQVLTNLIMNSLVHGFNEDQSGHIEIAVHTSGENIELFYHDDGKGIPKEFHQKVFNPFFTTARGKGGSGLGLHIVYNIATQVLKGSIELQTELVQGTTFILRFPRVLTD